jgi:hypothetical protein
MGLNSLPNFHMLHTKEGTMEITSKLNPQSSEKAFSTFDH